MLDGRAACHDSLTLKSENRKQQPRKTGSLSFSHSLSHTKKQESEPGDWPLLHQHQNYSPCGLEVSRTFGQPRGSVGWELVGWGREPARRTLMGREREGDREEDGQKSNFAAVWADVCAKSLKPCDWARDHTAMKRDCRVKRASTPRPDLDGGKAGKRGWFGGRGVGEGGWRKKKFENCRSKLFLLCLPISLRLGPAAEG